MAAIEPAANGMVSNSARSDEWPGQKGERPAPAGGSVETQDSLLSGTLAT
jgi:hypothetical protein